MTLDGTTTVLPGGEQDDRDLDDQGTTAPRFRRGTLVNGGILLALLLVVGLTVLTVRGSEDSASAGATQTASVSVGDVTATVSANGNIASGQTANVDFEGSGGIIRQILVKPGDKVRQGQALAVVDQTSAQQSLELARAQLSSAQASYDTTVAGQTPQERSRDAASVRQAEVSLTTARTNLSQARSNLSLTRRQQQEAVRRANNAVEKASDAVDQARATNQSDPTPEHRQALVEAQSAKSAAKTSQRSARNARDSSLLQARQQVTSAERSVKSAQAGLTSTKAGVAVNRQPARSGTVASAQAQIANAQVSVDQAQTALEQTTLRAPVGGTVAAVNGAVGEPSTSAGSSSTTGSSTSSTTASTGFVTLTNTKNLQVTADVAEADIADVRLGQSATITLSASGTALEGIVTAVDSIETITNNVVEYGVTVTLTQPKGLKLGQSTQVVVTTGSKANVLRVSSSALTTIGDRTTATVQSADGSTNVVQVTTGLAGDGFTEVLDGLTDGDVVVLPVQQDTGTGFTFPGGGGLGGLR
jgi:HlyD family secretion protein